MDSTSEKQFWGLKPFWCQPWSIISFGILVLISSWMLLNNIIITSVLFLLVVIWWILFLILAPISYQINSNENNQNL